MGRKFEIPEYYRSSVISTVKNARKNTDQRKKDFTPSILDLGKVEFKIARHFGFCYGVENAIEVAYRALAENPKRRIFLLSEMIHNPHVNQDLSSRGINFIMKTDGTQIVPFEQLQADDIVIIPAFGTQLEILEKLKKQGINPQSYNATCPFVEKVWKKAKLIGEGGFSVVIHGKYNHEETRATFSHARQATPAVIVKDLEETKLLAKYMMGLKPAIEFYRDFAGKFSSGFDVNKDLLRIGVVNQTTMLASETQTISEYLKNVMLEIYGEQQISKHFADTRDTLCYATLDNQQAVFGLVEAGADLALVVGGYNSSNTSHLVEICSEHMPTYYIKDADEILSDRSIRHFDLSQNDTKISADWLPKKDKLAIVITAGASCPDSLVDEVISKMARFLEVTEQLPSALENFQTKYQIGMQQTQEHAQDLISINQSK